MEHHSHQRRAYAAKVLLKHLATLSSLVHGVRHAEDIEYIHQMRVGSRRLRNAMDLFADDLPGKFHKRWLKAIKRVTKSLGAARDLDVQIVAVQRDLAECKSAKDRVHRAGIERLLLRLGQQRDAIQVDVAAAMDRLEATGVLEQMRESLMAMRVDARLRRAQHAQMDDVDAVAGDAEAAEPPQPESADDVLRASARDVILLRLERMLAYEPFVHSPQHVEELHAMRIAAKHLRYTMEAYATLFADRLKDQIKLVRQFQTLLGDIHDADVWLAFIPQFIDEERRRHHEFFGHLRGFKRIAGGLEHLLAKRAAKRQSLYEQFVNLWDEQTREDGWQKLRDSLDLSRGPADNDEIDGEAPDGAEASPVEPKDTRHGSPGSPRSLTHGSDNDPPS